MNNWLLIANGVLMLVNIVFFLVNTYVGTVVMEQIDKLERLKRSARDERS